MKRRSFISTCMALLAAPLALVCGKQAEIPDIRDGAILMGYPEKDSDPGQVLIGLRLPTNEYLWWVKAYSPMPVQEGQTVAVRKWDGKYYVWAAGIR